jgi:DNA (cytosine-5)-methyltransferase 1
MNVGSLFSGIGGIELGFEKAGFTTSWFVENNLFCQAVLRKRFPQAIIYGEIEDLDFETVPGVNILSFGFPCQDISVAGKGVGITGSRSSLWKYGCEAIRILRPRFALIENVSALINRGLYVVLSDLAKIGYDAEWHCISASAVGASHQRDRIFIIAYPNQRQRKDEPIQTGRNFAEAPAIDSNTDSERLSKQFQQEEEQSRVRFDRALMSSSFCKIDTSEAFILRGNDGIPNRLDRIKSLGNAVVPKCAEVFAKAIKEVMNKE